MVKHLFGFQRWMSSLAGKSDQCVLPPLLLKWHLIAEAVPGCSVLAELTSVSPFFVFKIKNQAYLQREFTFLDVRFVKELRFKLGYKLFFSLPILRKLY